MTTTKRTLKRGDVVLVLFPHSDLRTAKPRPALIVQTDNLESGLSQVVVAMITSRVFRANHPSRVLIKLDSLVESILVLYNAGVSTIKEISARPLIP
ncbi:MAG TPA: type II toxin-antitoxin system PemK/MazF family toxin [Anaerolineales bacterium]